LRKDRVDRIAHTNTEITRKYLSKRNMKSLGRHITEITL
jgi:hypothetical protein